MVRFGFNAENHKPLTTFILNCAGFNFANNFSGKFKFDGADFREGEFISGQRESALRETKTVETICTFESWKARLALFNSLKECFEGLINSFQNVLQNLRVNVFVFRISLLDFFELICLGLVIQRNSVKFVGISAFLQSGIVKISTKIKSFFKSGLDKLRGFADAKTEGFLDDLRSDFHYDRNDFRQGKSVVGETCLPIFHYTEVSHFLLSRRLIYVEKIRLKTRIWIVFCGFWIDYSQNKLSCIFENNLFSR